MASVYAPSSIHTKSTLSRKYDVDTSAMGNVGEKFKVRGGGQSSQIFSLFLTQFSLDIGRYDVSFEWMNYMRLITFSVLYLIASIGPMIIETKNMSSFPRGIFQILKFISLPIPESSSFYVKLIVILSFLLVYSAFILFLIYLIHVYKDNSCPSNFQVSFWVITSRLVIPLFTFFFSVSFSISLRNIVFQSSTQVIILFLISSLIILIQIIYLFFSSSIYNATPILREHDPSQFWFIFSKLDWEIPISIFGIGFIQTFFAFTTIIPIVFGLFGTLLSSFFSYYFINKLPLINPKSNVIYLWTTLSGVLFSWFPIIVNSFPKSSIYLLIGFIIAAIGFFFLAKQIINWRIHMIIRNFRVLSEEEIPNNSTAIDQLTAAMIQLDVTRNANFELLNLKNEKDFSIHLRIGFLYNIEEIISQQFIKWALERNAKADLVLTAAQVSYSLQNDIVLLSNIENLLHKQGQTIFNTKSFVTLFNNLRLELATQLNQPLEDAIGKARKSNSYLQEAISEFWSATLKQHLSTMENLISQISTQMINTELLFESLIRKYPKAQTLIREAITFYQFSAGNHKKSVECQIHFIRAKNHHGNKYLSDTSDSMDSTSFSDDDKDFKDKMELWVNAQEVIESISSPPKNCLYALLVTVFISMISVPAIILSVSIVLMNDFSKNYGPVNTISDIETSISRIPQLIRRRQLYETDSISNWIPSTGPPLSTHQEFINQSSIIPSIENYINILETRIQEFLELCNTNDLMINSCSAQNYSISDSNDANFTLYDLLSNFLISTKTIIEQSGSFNWSSADTTDQVMFIFHSFDSLFKGTFELERILSNNVASYSGSFSLLMYLWLALIWIFPIVIFFPFVILMVTSVKKEIRFILQLFFQIQKMEISRLKKKTRKTEINVDIEKNLEGSTTTQESNTLRDQELINDLATIPHKNSGLFGHFLRDLLILIIFTSLIVTFSIFIFNKSVQNIISLSTSYVSASEIYSLCFACYIWAQEIPAQSTIFNYSNSVLKDKTFFYFNRMINIYDKFLYGGELDGFKINGALLLGDDIIEKYLRPINNNSSETQYSPVYGMLHEVYSIMSCDSQMRLFQEATRMILNTSLSVSFSEEFIYHYEHLIFSHLSSYLLNGRASFQEDTNVLNLSTTSILLCIYIILWVAQFLFFFTILLKSFRELLHHLKTPRYLMLLVNPEVLLKAQRIVRWISGFTTSSKALSVDKAVNSRANQCEFTIHSSSCCLLILDENFLIKKYNKTTLKIFKIHEHQIINQSIHQFLDQFIIDKQKEMNLMKLDRDLKKMHDGCHKTNHLIINTAIFGMNAQISHISIEINGYTTDDDLNDELEQLAPPARTFSVVVTDQSQEVHLETLLNEEKKRQEKLLYYLYPDQIAKRVRSGEKDISFLVQHSSIMYSTITNFDQIVGQLQLSPSQIFSFLGALFGKFDTLIASSDFSSNITKIKSVGNAYIVFTGMSANENINPAQPIIEFGLRMITITNEFVFDIDPSDTASKTFSISEKQSIIGKKESKELKKPNDINGQIKSQIGHISEKQAPLNLCMTSGINTGGPISCRIIGKQMNTFDVFGETVNVAKILNDTGLNGMIQISESTYDAIKFLKFNIKEREKLPHSQQFLKKTYLITPNTTAGEVTSSQTQ